MTNVILIDDQALFRQGMAMILSSQTDLNVIAEGGDGAEAVGLVQVHRPDVVIMDVRMPIVDGVAATAALQTEFGSACPKVLVLTTFDTDEAAARAIDAGASGFILKDAEPEFLLAAIRAIARGDQVVSAPSTRELFRRHRTPIGQPGVEYQSLTAREVEIFLLAAEGLSNAEIAAREFLSEATVKTHVSRILSKLALRDRVQLVVYAFRHDLI